LSGQNVIITGSNTGIGYETARVLLLHNAHVIIASRSRERVEAAVLSLSQSTGKGENVQFIALDLADLSSIRAFSENYLSLNRPLHLLINNAGIMALPERSLTADGFEAQFGTNHLGHFYLTSLLLPSLRAAVSADSPARIVNLSSAAHRGSHIIWDDVMLEKSYTPYGSYGQSKTANILFTMGLHKRYHAEGIHSYAVHPGVIRTELGRHSTLASIFYVVGFPFMKSIPQGAATTVYCATAPEVLEKGDGGEGEDGSGKYYADCNVEPTSRPLSVADADRLWELSEHLIADKVAPK